MSRWQTLKKGLTDRDYRTMRLAKAGFYNRLEDQKYLEKVYRARMGRTLNLENPQLFSEKLQWLKLNDHNPLYTQLVDKYRVREYITEKIGEEYLFPLLGVWDDPDEIDFNALPDQFVLKCNHNSGKGMCICRDKSKLDYAAVRKGLKKGLQENFYLRHREWPYKNVQRKIIAEKFMPYAPGKNGLDDYRFFCFHGEPKLVYVYQTEALSFDNKPSVSSRDIFDMNWNHLPVRQKSGNAPTPPLPPASFSKMVELSKCLSKNIPFLRVDFYEIQGKVYVGELTLYPFGGVVPFDPPDWDETIGAWLTLPPKND